MTTGTLLLRQVNPKWVQAGRVTSQLFRPTPKDNKRTSVYDGDQITAESSWSHFTVRLGFLSVGVMSVTVGECNEQDLPAEPDPAPFPEHAVIKFDGCGSNSEIEKKAKKLRNIAVTRGWQYEADK